MRTEFNRAKKVANIEVRMKQLMDAVERENASHVNECKECRDFRNKGIGDDLCMEGRRRQQMVYLMDETTVSLHKTVTATNYEEMFGTFRERK